MLKLLATCLACLLPATAMAASGELWEVTTKTEMPGMPFAMPATTMQVCMDKGDVSDPRRSAAPDKDCKITDVRKSGNKTTWKMRCNRNGEVMTGNGVITTTASGYEGTTRVKGKSGGHDINMTSHFSGKKLGKSCDASKQRQQLEQARKQAEQQRRKAAAPSSKDADDSGSSLGESAKKLKGLLGF